MESLLRNTVNSFYSDFQVKCEVYNVIQDAICDIEVWNSENNMLRISHTLDLSETLNKKLVDKIHSLESKNKSISSELLQIKLKAGEVREQFVTGIDRLLAESKQNKKMQDKRGMLMDSISQTDDVVIAENEEEETVPIDSENSPPISDQTNIDSAQNLPTDESPAEETTPVEPVSEPEPKEPSYPMLFDFQDEVLLECFAFLNEEDIYSIGYVCKHMFFRVDSLFGMQSPLVQASWENKIPVIYVPPPVVEIIAPVVEAPSAAVPAVVAPVTAPTPVVPPPQEQGVKLTREFMMEITKKLTGELCCCLLLLRDR